MLSNGIAWLYFFFCLKLAEYPKPLFESKASKWLVCYTAVFSVTKKRLCIADYQITNERSLVTGKLSRRRDNARTHCETDRELRLISLYRSIISPWKTKISPNIKILTKHLLKIKKKKILVKHHRALSFNDFWVTDQNYFLNNWGFSKECDWSSRNKHEKWSSVFL